MDFFSIFTHNCVTFTAEIPKLVKVINAQVKTRESLRLGDLFAHILVIKRLLHFGHS